MMRRNTVRGCLAVAGITAATTLAWTASPPQAHAEPECLTGSNDFDRDHTVDVAVGMPGAKNGAGAVEVRLSDEGDGRTVRVEAPDAKAGDRFGASVAEIGSYRDEGDDPRCSLLVVGAPGRDAGGQNDAGAVFVYSYDSSENRFTLLRELVQGSYNVPDEQPQAGANFGASLASRYNEPDQIGSIVSRLYVGAPGTDVGSATDAGAFVTFELSRDDTAEDAKMVSQGAGAPGTPESGDRFGSALAAVSGGVLAGAPGENGNSGGFVHWHDGDGKNVFVTQNTTGVPGTSEAGDEYGAAIYSAREASNADGGHMLLVGAPGEALGTRKQAGTVHLFRFEASVMLDDVKGFNQDTSGVAGTAEAGDRFGAALGTFGVLDPLVGVPGEDIGDLKDAGSISAVRGNRAWTQDTAGMPGKVEAGDRFGATVGNAKTPFGTDDDFWHGAPLVGAPGENGGAGSVTAGLATNGSTPPGWTQQNAQAGDGYGTSTGKVN